MKQRNKHSTYRVGSGPVDVLCNLNGSFRIADKDGVTIALIKCDRTNIEDNARGLAIATLIQKALNDAEVDRKANLPEGWTMKRSPVDGDFYVYDERRRHACGGYTATDALAAAWVCVSNWATLPEQTDLLRRICAGSVAYAGNPVASARLVLGELAINQKGVLRPTDKGRAWCDLVGRPRS